MMQAGWSYAPNATLRTHLFRFTRYISDRGFGRRKTTAGTLWDFMTERLVPYLVEMGFTHVELLPITEHPFGGSWGYQPLSLFAPSARYGPPAGLVEVC